MPATLFICPLGLFCQTMTTRLGSRYGKGRRITASNTLKMAVFAPMPSARVRMAATQNPGCFASVRRINRTSIPKMLPHFRDQWLIGYRTEEPMNRITEEQFLFFFLFFTSLGCLSRGYDLLGLQRRDVIVVVELHVERGAPLRHRNHIVLVVEHFRHRRLGADNLGAALGVHTLNAAPPAVEIAHQIAGIFHGSLDFDVHNRSEER